MTTTTATKTPKTRKTLRGRPTFDEIRTIERQRVTQQQRAYYESKLEVLAEEINLMQEALREQRLTLEAVQGSWLTALRYWAKGRV